MAFATCTRRVMAVFNYLDVPFELVVVDLRKGEQKAPEYLEKQPFGQVPYLDDDGFVVFESRAIARYVASGYGKGKLIPQELQGGKSYTLSRMVNRTADTIKS